MKSNSSGQTRQIRGPVAIGVAAIAMTAILATIWWQKGEAFWSDGRDIYVPASDTRVREVLWTRPSPLNLLFDGKRPTADQFYEPSLSPDGNELYFVRGKPGTGARIFTCHRRSGGGWTPPLAIDAVNGDGYDALGPRVTADGKFLLFSSNRPGGLGGYDIWAAPRLSEHMAAGGWGTPYNLGAPLNSEFNEYNPDPTPDGRRLIFSTDRLAASLQQKQAWRGTIRASTTADFDLWIVTMDAFPSTQPATQPSQRLSFVSAMEILGINTPYTEGASCMSPAGDFLYFASNRPGGYGKFDIYRSRVTGDVFGPPENLGPTINSSANETDPALAMQGFRLYFSSDRSNDHGLYDLFASDSRDVFVAQEARDLPHLGWSSWSLLGSAALLLPLILLLHGTRNRRLSMLQQCLILSLVVHAAAAFLFSFVIVTQEVTRYARRESAVRVDLNLNIPRDVEIGMAMRAQFSAESSAASSDDTAISAIPASKRIASGPQLPEAILQPPTAPRSELAETISTRLAASPAMPLLHRVTHLADKDTDAVVSPITIAPEATALVGVSIPAGVNSVSQPELAMQMMPPQFELETSSRRSSAPTRSSVLTEATAAIAPPPSRPITPPIRLQGTSTALRYTGHDHPAADQFQVDAPVAPVEPGLLQSLRMGPARGGSKEPERLIQGDDTAVSTTQPVSTATLSASRGELSASHLEAIALPPLAASTRPFTARVVLQSSTRAEPSMTSSRAIGAPPALTPIAPEITTPGNPLHGTGASNIRVLSPEVTGDRLAQSTTMPATRFFATGVGLVSTEFDILSASVKPNGPAPSAIMATTSPAPQPSTQQRSDSTSSALAPIALDGPLGPGSVTAGESAFPRSQRQRKVQLEHNGGTDASEKAVDQGLAYLARMQQDDGRWTQEMEDPAMEPHGGHPHDAACTGLALLAFLSRDSSPDKDGSYRTAVARGLDYLLTLQEDDGDLRGRAELRGAGSNRANMYDHAIATLALAEAALMSQDRRYREAAFRGARFIVAAQDPQSGGWRYLPGEYGDSSVFGWQIMALHAAEELGQEIPPETRRSALRYLQACGQGERSLLAGYQPGQAPTVAMTAELLYSRMLLGQEPDRDDLSDASDFIFRQTPGATSPDLYCWYYGSLCLLQTRSDMWNRWNKRTRETLIGLQDNGDGPLAGSWNSRVRWGAQGGRVFTTSLAVLTLEVYYRYK